MVKITMYGQPTSNYEFVKMKLKQKLSKAGLELKINEISDWTQIVKYKVESLPTIVVNDKIRMSYSDDQNINNFVQDLVTKILKEEKYGDMKRIIVPTDFSETATNALVYARSISKELNGVIQLLHVYKPEVVPTDSAVIINEELELVRKKQLDEFVNKINQSWSAGSNNDLPIDAIFKVGFVTEELDSMCKGFEDECFVIVGSTGSSGTLKKIFGSVTTQLAKNVKCPILIIPPSVTFRKITDIVFTVDAVEKDIIGLPKVLEYASKLNARLHLVHVKEDDDFYPDNVLMALAKDIYPDVKVYFVSIDGPNVASAINDFAITNKIDIVSAVTQDRGFFADLFHKSITKKMTLNTEVPLLIFHA